MSRKAVQLRLVRIATKNFIKILDDNNLMEYPELFEELADAALKVGYDIKAIQHGISGTSLSFEAAGTKE